MPDAEARPLHEPLYRIIGVTYAGVARALADAHSFEQAHRLWLTWRPDKTYWKVVMAPLGDPIRDDVVEQQPVRRGGRGQEPIRPLIMAAAHSIGEKEFSLVELTLACWEIYPLQFGLAGHERQHPDTHKVYPALCGARGLVSQGFLVKLGPYKYALPKE